MRFGSVVVDPFLSAEIHFYYLDACTLSANRAFELKHYGNRNFNNSSRERVCVCVCVFTRCVGVRGFEEKKLSFRLLKTESVTPSHKDVL